MYLANTMNGGEAMASDKHVPKHRYSQTLDGRVVAYFHGAMRWNRQPGDKLTLCQRPTIVGVTITIVLVIAILTVVFASFMAVTLEGYPARSR